MKQSRRVESQRPALTLLFLCTANRCRSPIAEAFLTRALRDLGLHARVTWAGMLPAGHPAPRGARAVMRRRGLDLSSHERRTASTELLESSDLVIGMTREHVREVSTRVPEAWTRTFTLKQLVRLGEAAGSRGPDQDLTDWLAHIHALRRPADMLGSSADDDVADPYGSSRRVYEEVTDEIGGLVGRFVALPWPQARVSAPSESGRAETSRNQR